MNKIIPPSSHYIKESDYDLGVLQERRIIGDLQMNEVLGQGLAADILEVSSHDPTHIVVPACRSPDAKLNHAFERIPRNRNKPDS